MACLLPDPSEPSSRSGKRQKRQIAQVPGSVPVLGQGAGLGPSLGPRRGPRFRPRSACSSGRMTTTLPGPRQLVQVGRLHVNPLRAVEIRVDRAVEVCVEAGDPRTDTNRANQQVPSSGPTQVPSEVPSRGAITGSLRQLFLPVQNGVQGCVEVRVQSPGARCTPTPAHAPACVAFRPFDRQSLGTASSEAPFSEVSLCRVTTGWS